MTKPSWTDTRIKLGDIDGYPNNPRMSTKAQAQRIIASEKKFGQPLPFICNPPVNGRYMLLDGHQRLAAWLTIYGGDHVMDARIADRPLTDDEHRELIVTLHTGATGSWDWDRLSSWDSPQLQEWGMNTDALKQWNNDANNLKELIAASQPEPVDAEPQIDRAAELAEKWQTASGQLWKLADHRLLIGDCTEVINVSKLLGGCNVNLVHADPPYGMGKNEIENDNLYAEKLDTFQMQWFDKCRPFIADNSSVYIWGTAEDLWRLWFAKLSKSERMTIRNEIVWDKGSGQGMGSDAHRMYPTASERCLFFVLGEQGWNNNADNYWEGFEPIRAYLEGERMKMGWNNKIIAYWFGFHPRMADHWFSQSQWSMPIKEQYQELQSRAKGEAFRREYDELRREYDELRREWYATRAAFNNTHALMTDVWKFETMRGEDRPDHPTPKPVELIERIFKTSGTNDAIIYSPFLGSGTDIIAGENCGRKVYGTEKDEKYGAVILQRFFDATGITPELIG